MQQKTPPKHSPTELPIIESLVTYLEMTSNSGLSELPLGELSLSRDKHPTVDSYLDIYRAVGRDYLWNYRPGQSREEIEGIIESPSQWLYLLHHQGKVVGMAELDASNPKDIELVHFGLLPSYLHQGIGNLFLHNITSMVWSAGAERMRRSTCGMDHPKAIRFYENAGFKIFKTKMAESADPAWEPPKLRRQAKGAKYCGPGSHQA